MLNHPFDKGEGWRLPAFGWLSHFMYEFRKPFIALLVMLGM
ncbi:hypothetical protein ECMP0209401_2026 [Escherichia coli MP020940.1]|nr:hypothetical protein ECMP0215527_1904 [Escherichia coli MP021552.7]EMU63995.1 hypothetical protein ECMP02155212_5153 [Escherichia coli MP021552.12]EMV14891.1 hypothetical protein ECC34666_4983 [Escherichia coli C-34666]EMV85655.1 hypothetical protein EC2865200_4759 [Escherichia coli 2865200]EMW38565.1 hypothetical protein EC2788150_4752 [Escherichia coli 2788150]EMW49378.1 hypothetical protein EC2780750_2196 [Escherichia coli 2780750]EMX29928.1 hypothetical protein ECMP0215612_3416 [Escher